MIEIIICVGSACHLKGSYQVITAIQNLIGENKLEDKIEIKGSFCLGHCTTGVSLRVNDGPIISANVDNVNNIFHNHVIPLLNKNYGGGL
ncbi:MAG: (2Fe-2S) ferredoxin domain-containing protein [Bacillota bacterium]|nr:(2Fe-2S) ferredoxin domain-containing protein [Bacillota bacterium]